MPVLGQQATGPDLTGCRHGPEALAGTLTRHLPGPLTTINPRRHDHMTPKGTIQKVLDLGLLPRRA